MNRPRRDLDDLERFFDEDEAAARRNDREERLATGAALLAQEAEVDARIKASALAFTRKANEDAILRDYRRAGLEPVRCGGMLVTLPMLIKIGWTIEDAGNGERRLVAPPKEQPRVKTDYR